MTSPLLYGLKQNKTKNNAFSYAPWSFVFSSVSVYHFPIFFNWLQAPCPSSTFIYMSQGFCTCLYTLFSSFSLLNSYISRIISTNFSITTKFLPSIKHTFASTLSLLILMEMSLLYKTLNCTPSGLLQNFFSRITFAYSIPVG